MTSELFTSSRMIFRPWGCFRCTAMDFLLRLMVLKYKDVFVTLGFHSLSSPDSRQSLVSSCNCQHVCCWTGWKTYSSLGMFHLDHLRAIVGQNLCTEWSLDGC